MFLLDIFHHFGKDIKDHNLTQAWTMLNMFKHYKHKPNFPIIKDKGKGWCSSPPPFYLIWSHLIQFPIETNLIQLDLIWSNLDQLYLILSYSNPIIKFANNQSDPTWSDLNQFDPTGSNWIFFRPIWTNLIWLDLIWTKLFQFVSKKRQQNMTNF